MASSASIAQEFYKVRNEWERIDHLKSWRLAIWVAQYQDVDIIDKFLETERLAIGVFDDIFFRFDTEYKDNQQEFEAALWQEYLEWFVLPEGGKYDMYTGLKNDGLLKEEYLPNKKLPPTFESILKELLRFKSCVKGVEEKSFCIYFPPTRPDAAALGNWFNTILKSGIPNGIRLVTIDFAVKRKVKISATISPMDVVELSPTLNMMEAISNEMDKGCGTYDTVTVEAQFTKQIRVVMNSTVKKKVALTDKEVNTLLSLSKQMGSISAAISGLLIASQAYFSIGENQKSEQYCDEAIKKAETAMEQNDPAGYPTWRSCMLLKGALLMGRKKLKEAIVYYEKMADKASKSADAYFAMEGFRLSGHLYYEEKELEKSFEKLLFSLVAGSYLTIDIRRSSTFLHAAYLALHVGEKIKTKNEVKAVEQELEAWLGKDWSELLQQEGVSNAKTKQKTSFFETINR